MSTARASIERRTERQSERNSALTELMRADALLPEDLVPGRAGAIETSAVLVTGATGFLGRQIVREQLLAHGAGLPGRVVAEEARRIHYREADSRNIYGEATDRESAELREEGIEFGSVPWPPRHDA
mgnify:CR=1 FL=1